MASRTRPRSAFEPATTMRPSVTSALDGDAVASSSHSSSTRLYLPIARLQSMSTGCCSTRIGQLDERLELLRGRRVVAEAVVAQAPSARAPHSRRDRRRATGAASASRRARGRPDTRRRRVTSCSWACARCARRACASSSVASVVLTLRRRAEPRAGARFAGWRFFGLLRPGSEARDRSTFRSDARGRGSSTGVSSRLRYFLLGYSMPLRVGLRSSVFFDVRFFLSVLGFALDEAASRRGRLPAVRSGVVADRVAAGRPSTRRAFARRVFARRLLARRRPAFGWPFPAALVHRRAFVRRAGQATGGSHGPGDRDDLRTRCAERAAVPVAELFLDREVRRRQVTLELAPGPGTAACSSSLVAPAIADPRT